MKFTPLFRFIVTLLAATTLHAGDAAHTFDVKSGTVSCVFNPAVVGKQPLLSVKFARISPGAYTSKRNGINAPIVAGAFQPSDARTELVASGGFKLINGGLDASLIDFVFDLPNDGSPASVSATLTDNGRYLGRIVLSYVEVSDLNIITPVQIPPNKRLFLKNIPLTLTAEAAGLLNDALGLTDAYNDTDVIATLTLNFKLGGQL